MVDISAAAEISTRNQVIANALAGLPEPLVSVEQKVVNVRVVSDVAIVEGTYVLRLREGSGVREERGVFTHVWERVRNAWGCVSAQRTAVVDRVEGKRGDAPGGGAEEVGRGRAVSYPAAVQRRAAENGQSSPVGLCGRLWRRSGWGPWCGTTGLCGSGQARG